MQSTPTSGRSQNVCVGFLDIRPDGCQLPQIVNQNDLIEIRPIFKAIPM